MSTSASTDETTKIRDRVEDVKRRVLDALHLAYCVVAPIALAATLLRVRATGWSLHYAWLSVSAVFTMALYLVRSRMSTVVRVWLLCGSAMITGTSSLFALGLSSGGILYFVSSPLTLALFIGTRASFVALTLEALAMIVAAVLTTKGLSAPFVDLNRYNAAPAAWIDRGMQIVFMSAMLSACLAALHGALESLIVELSTSERRLVDSESAYRDVFEGVADGILVLAPAEARVLTANGRAAAIFGLGRGELDGRAFQELCAGVDVGARVEDALSLGPQTFTGSAIGRASSVPVEITMRRSEVRGVERVLADVRDVSERVHAEAQLRASEERLHQTQKLAAIGELAGGIAHDFNNLLCVIGGSIELTLLGDDGVESGHLEAAQKACRRASDLTKQLLAFARRGKTRSEPIDVRGIVRGTADLLSRTVGGRIRVAVSPQPENAAVVVGDATQLETALLNLGINARDAMPDGGTIRLGVRAVTLSAERAAALDVRAGPFVELVVSDEGTGINPSVLPHVFEPFFTTKAAGKGTGLGLAAVMGIARAHDGTVTVESERGRGTVFGLLLPSQGAAAVAPIAVPEGPVTGTGLVLVVDDEAYVRAAVRALLEKLGYRVADAEDGRAALDVARAQVPDAVLLDANLPGLTPLEILDELDGIRPGVPVLVTSGMRTGPELTAVLARSRGFLPKPFTLRELATGLSQILART